jgi:hypothetical protein
MQTRHPVRAALFAALVPLAVIAVFGNSWWIEHVRFRDAHSQLYERFLGILNPFTWTFTPRRGRGSGTLWFGQALGVVVVVLGVFLVVWLVARHAVSVSLWIGAWGATVLVAMVGAMVTTFVNYGVLFGNTNVDGYGRFWHSVFAGQDVALWGAWVGFFVGVLAALLVGGVDNQPAYVMSAPLPGATAWSPALPAQPAYVEQPTYTMPPATAAPPAPAEPTEAPAPLRRAPGDPTVLMVRPNEWSAPPTPPPQPEA